MIAPSRFWTPLAPVFAGVFIACYTNPAVEGDGSHSSATADPATNRISATIPGSDLSCELAQLLADRCQKCHGAKPVTGAEVSLLGRNDLVAPSPDDPKKTVIALALERLTDSDAPMPPPPEAPPTAAEISLVQNWVSAGMPVQSCSADKTPTAPPPEADPYDTPTICTSKKTWTGADDGSFEMHPGRACIACHSKNLKTIFKAAFDVAGTVYPTAHEPDDCYGAAGGSATVVITDANNAEYKLPVNAAGNFGHETTLGLAGKIAMPYRAKIVRNGVERVMTDPQDSGDCNGCHTEQGTNTSTNGKKAPGRILLP
jgi:hypothetical protein